MKGTIFKWIVGCDETRFDEGRPDDFHPVYRKGADDIIRQAGWERSAYIEADGRRLRFMDIRLERRPKESRWEFQATVSLEPAIRSFAALPNSQDVLQVFPIEEANLDRYKTFQSEWRDTPGEAFDDIAMGVTKAVRRIYDAMDRRHERMMPVFDIWAGEPASGYFLPDQESPHERTPGKVERIADHVKGENFRDAVEKWAKRNRRGFVGGGVASPVTVDGLHVFPDEESANAWILTEESRPKNEPFNVSIEPLSSKALTELPLFDIWMEGFQATGQSGTARLLCQCRGADFIDAVRNAKKFGLLEGHGDLRIDEEKQEAFLWGCQLYDNEQDARRNFG